MIQAKQDSGLTGTSVPSSGLAAWGPAALTGGFGASAALMLAAYVLHFPGLAVPGPVVGIAMLAALGATLYAFARASGRGAALAVGAGAGAVAGLATLLALGSTFADADASGGRLAGMALGWVAIVTVLGAIAGVMGRATAKAGAGLNRPWAALLAMILAVSTLGLITMGGIVTAAEAGLAVPDWPGTFGANMFLYPLSQMTGGIYYEHAHRLMGAFVGLTTIALMALCFWKCRSALVRALSAVALVHVIIQGVIGGVRVTEMSTGLAIAHGVSAQVFFALVLVIALMNTGAWGGAGRLASARAGKQVNLSIAALALLFVQVSLGAVARHFPDSIHGLLTHAGFSLVAAAGIVLAGAHAASLAKEEAHDRTLEKLGKAGVHTVSLQMLLGVAALGVVMMFGDAETPHALDLTVTTAHQVVGAVLVGVTSLLFVWSLKTLKGRGAPDTLAQ